MKIENYYDCEYGLPFKAFIPDKLPDNPALIVQLHGVGERGNGGEELEKVTAHGFPKIVNDDNLSDCILVCPQCPNGTFWVAKIETVKNFIDRIVEKYNIDSDRIYLCGLSMGGYGTWYTAQAYPDFFAAIAPCCGGGMCWYAPILQMPIWAFHGKEDTAVPVSETINMIERLEGRNENLKYTLYENVGHESFTHAFNEELLSWLLQHKR